MTAEQVNEVVREIRERVRGRYEKQVDELPDFTLPTLDPLGHARDAAEGKSASIGTVNPRPPGVLNNAAQAIKRKVARALDWFVRDQVHFNQAVVRYMDANLEASIEQNHQLLLAGKEMAALKKLRGGIDDMLHHWNEWRPALEEKLTKAEIDLLHRIRSMEKQAREREGTQSEGALKMHQNYLDSLKTSTERMQHSLNSSLEGIQKQFWSDLAKLKSEQERLIHTELKLIRQRPSGSAEAVIGTVPQAQPDASPVAGSASSPESNQSAASPAPAPFDYANFEERFRGSEATVRERQQFYLPYFKNCRRIVDLGCGRGEFLELLKENGVAGVGVDLNPDAISACRAKSIEAHQSDIFGYLSAQPDESFDGIFCVHVVEHLAPETLPNLVNLAARKLKPGGLLAIETPNPGCLAIFAGDFYLDPTHQKPVPSRQLDFYLQEAGFTEIEHHELNPASEVFPELAAMDEMEALRGFRSRFFGGLDYTIIGRKMSS
jgi:SAM-dependent methyltransferase